MRTIILQSLFTRLKCDIIHVIVDVHSMLMWEGQESYNIIIVTLLYASSRNNSL